MCLFSAFLAISPRLDLGAVFDLREVFRVSILAGLRSRALQSNISNVFLMIITYDGSCEVPSKNHIHAVFRVNLRRKN